MQLTQESIQEVETIMGEMDCPFDFQCYKSGFEDLCGSLLVDGGKYIKCVNKKTVECKLSSLPGSEFLCACPLRLYVASKYKK